MSIPRRKVRYWFDAVFGRLVGQDNWRLLKAYTHFFFFRFVGLGIKRDDIIYSLTSFPGRQNVLRKTVVSILGQKIIPKTIYLVITRDDWRCFNESNRQFLEMHCTVKLVDEDLRSYKKLYYSLIDFPRCRIVTFDDDLYYEFDAVAKLLKEELEGDTILCRRAHLIRLNNGAVKPYNEWGFEVDKDVCSKLVFPTSGGVMMVLPNAFHPEVLKVDIFMDEADGADDMWWYFMMRKCEGIARKCGGQMRLYEWEREDDSGLYVNNLSGGNDSVFQDLQRRYKLSFT